MSGLSSVQSKAIAITQIEQEHTKRYPVGIEELDRVLGGGLVRGAVTLLGGEPGIGKSTLLLTLAHKMAQQGYRSLYISAEESTSQTRMTAERLDALHDNLYLLSETNLQAALLEVERIKPEFLVLDSVQTLYAPELDAASGSVSQIREVTARVVGLSKTQGINTFLVGHVTKEGNIAGPRLLEHMVDTVLYFEATKTGPYRFLRAHKNRFGSTNEMGVFEMRSSGLLEIKNPSAFFLAERPMGKPGSSVAVAIEGTRPLLVEVQALCVQTFFGTPRRTTSGVDTTRAAVLAAVLEKHAGLALSGYDLFVNVAGGAQLVEPAADLPIALAIASSLTNRPIKSQVVCFGEVGLSGEIRGVNRVEQRLHEAKRLGFCHAIVPKATSSDIRSFEGMRLSFVATIDDAIAQALEEF